MSVSVARRAGARIVVTGTAPPAAAARSFLRAELDDVRFLDVDVLGDVRSAGGGCAVAADLEDTLRDADMLVFVAGAAETADERRTAALAEAARERGMLVAAVVVGHDRSGRSALLEALREAADMVMFVRDPDDVHAVVSALR
ncbi:MAG: hypothetical protein QOD51_2536 [Candidatus Eremiobacteraeota bacterium]|nr:hypothetical protein [Candidatus Eremiobacteraeota bacterium]